MTKPFHCRLCKHIVSWIAIISQHLGYQFLHRFPLPHSIKDAIVKLIFRVGGDIFSGIPSYDGWKHMRELRSAIAGDGQTSRTNAENIILPHSPTPLVSIVIPAYGQLPAVINCLKSIAAYPPHALVEVIVVEDASGQTDMESLRRVTNLRLIFNERNLGFILSCNAAIDHAHGRFVLLLNSDTEVTEHFLDSLLLVFSTRPDCGLAGSKLLFADNRLQEAGGIIWNDGSAWNYGRHQDPLRSCFNYLKEVDYCSGAAILFEKNLFNQIGRFDASFVPAYCEDSDLAFKVRQAGKKVYYQPASVVFHIEGLSHGTDLGSGLKAYQLVNQKKLRRKWSKQLADEHHPPGRDIFLARDRSSRTKHVLVVDHYIPQPDCDAGSKTIVQMITQLLEMGYRVTFWPHNMAYDRHYAPRLQALGVEILYGLDTLGSFGSWFKEHGKYIDHIWLSRPEVATPHLPKVRKYSAAPILYYGHDIHFLRMTQQYQQDLASTHRFAAALRSAIQKYGIWRMESMEKSVWRNATAVLYPSDSEMKVVNDFRIAQGLAPNAYTLPAFAFDQLDQDAARDLPKRRELLFVGGFRHLPNCSAAHWLVSEILPLIWNSEPTAKLLIVGSNPSDDIRNLASERVVVTGHVSDFELERLYRRARVAVVPLTFGGGIKGKIAEAMSFGLPVVTTDVGAQGFDLTTESLCIGNTPIDFANCVLQLIADDPHWKKQSDRCLRYAESHFTSVAMRKAMENAISTTLACENSHPC